MTVNTGPYGSHTLAPGVSTHAARGICFGLLCAAIFQACWPTVQGLVHVWNTSDTYAHCWAIPPICLWLLYQSRDARQSIPLSTSSLAPFVAAGAGGVWFLGNLAGMQLVQQLALVALLHSAALACFGLAWCRAAAFPLAFLFMAVPVGQELTPLLVDMTADFVVRAVEITGIPIYREGNSFMIPTGSWSVVSGCSGVRYLMATLTVGMLFAYLNYRAWQRRLIFILLAAVVAIGANWLRAFGIVMIAHHSGMRLALGIDHFIYGWVFFGIVIFVLISVGAAWREPALATSVSPQRIPLTQHKPDPRRVVIPLLCLLLVQGWSLLAGAVWRTEPARPLTISAGEIPLPPSWTVADAPSGESWAPLFAGKPQRLGVRGSSIEGGSEFGIDIAWFARQTQGSELHHAGHRLVHEKHPRWLKLGGPQRWVPGHQLPGVRESLLGTRQDESRLLIWQLDWVAGEFAETATDAMLGGLWGLLSGRGNAAATVTLHVYVQGAEQLEEARSQLQALLAASLPTLESKFRTATAAGD